MKLADRVGSDAHFDLQNGDRLVIENELFENQLRNPIDAIPTLVWATRSDGSAEFFNRRWLDYTGLTMDEARDWGWTAAIHPEDLSHLTDRWRAMIASGEPGEAEARLRRSGGEYRWFLFRAVPLRDEVGNIFRWYGTSTDIEDRRLAEEKIRQAEGQLRAAIDTIPAIVWTTLADGANDFHNQRLLACTGLSPEQAQGMGWTAMFHPNDVARHLETWKNAVEAGASFECESRMRQFDGEYRWFLARAEPLRDERGDIVKWYGTNFDIDDRKRAEQALRRSEAYLAEAQLLSRTGSFGWIPASGDIHWSRQSYRIFEVDPAVKPTIELIYQRTHPDDLGLVRASILLASRDQQDFNITHRLLMPDGSVKYIHVLSHRVINEEGNLEVVGALMDITATKQAEDALRQNEQRLRQTQAELAHVTRVVTLGELAASIAHEVNQPLSAVVTNAEACLRWLDRGAPDADAARRSVEWIINDSNRASEVIRRIRMLAKKTEIEKVALDVNDVLKEVIALLQSELTSHRVSLQLELPPTLPTIVADRVQLQQVIINLVMNGIEAMQSVTDRRHALVIQSRQEERQQVHVSVTDYGVGISTENAERLFNAFFTTKSGGMGMGLSICRSIIEAHGGRLWATANTPYGATFEFTLPVNVDHAA
jgi:PAS domain S-box-containing protein